MNRLYTGRKSMFIAGTALLGATVAVLDWLSKIFSLKIPFPLLTPLKFDVIGIPTVISYLLFGPLSGIIACIVAFLSISFRNPFSGFMKGLAELATVIGAFLILRAKNPSVLHKRKKIFAGISSIALRVIIENKKLFGDDAFHNRRSNLLEHSISAEGAFHSASP